MSFNCRNVARLLMMAALLLPLIPVAGCGSSDGLKKVVVRGQVSFDGQPIKNGEIRFFPLENTPGPVSGAPIRDGLYIADTKGGVPVGKHRVEIEAYKPPGGVYNPDAAAARVQYMPKKFNQASDLTTDISDDQDPVVRDFLLSS
jgi:hypothetical protein